MSSLYHWQDPVPLQDSLVDMADENSETESEEKVSSEVENERSTEAESNKEAKEAKKAADEGDATSKENKKLEVKNVGEEKVEDEGKKDGSEHKGSGDKAEECEIEGALAAAATVQEDIKKEFSTVAPRVLSMFVLYGLPWLYWVVMSLMANALRHIDPVCKHDYCVQAAMYVQSSINMSHKPCDNFYDYVCDGWRESYGDDVNAGVTLLNMSQYFQRSNNITPNALKALDVLEFCHSSFSSVVDANFDDLQLFLKNTLRLNWPARTRGGVQAVADIVVYLQMTYDVHPFFHIRLTSGMKLLSVNVNERYHPWYLHYRLTQQAIFREKLISAVAFTMSSSVHPNLISNIIAIEDAVEKIAAGVDTKRQLIKIKVLSHREFNFTWPFISALWRYCRPRQRQLMARRTTSAVYAEWKLRAILTLLTNATHAEATLDYIGWVVIESLGRRLSPTLRRTMAQVCDAYKVSHIARLVFRTDNCFWETYRLFALVLDRQNFHSFNRSLLMDVDHMFGELVRRVKNALYVLPWMDQTTRRRMVKRLSTFSCNVGLMKKYRYHGVEAVYDKLEELNPDDSFLNVSLRITKLLNMHYLSLSFRGSYPPQVWSAVPAIRFVHDHDTVFVPTSMVVLPLYERSTVPISLLYGRAAVQMAMAIFHEGYRSHTAMADTAWTFVTERRFQVFTECVTKGFDNKTTLLGDPALAFLRVAALRIAFQMYQLSTLKVRKDTVLHLENATTPLTAHQLFFIGSCLDLCTRDEEQLNEMMALCNLPMRRLKRFAEAFSCDSGDKLGPLYFPCTPLRLAKQYYRE